ncbi:hypothetical protein GUJ93_ZPchr0006g40617 [Zizania palustris]|uniref:Uncharacterized protein n=1 Tax=Zizania palustris TaxID=103762 RepID=A0A8J5W3P9_ZIZPA|nr:hypothetical protein GUJ93_ZPchr0006g40617 [Zizania palustris]
MMHRDATANPATIPAALPQFQVLNWVQTRLHRTRGPEPTAFSSRRARTPGGLHRHDELDGWVTTMLSIGTFGMTEGDGSERHHGSWTAGADELDRTQKKLGLLVRAKRVAGAEDDEGSGYRLTSKSSVSRTLSSTNGREMVKLKHRSLRKLVASAFSGFLPRSSLRETMPEPSIPEAIWSLLHKDTHPKKPAFPEPMIDVVPTTQTHQKDTAGGQEQDGIKWIKTDSECKFI